MTKKTYPSKKDTIYEGKPTDKKTVVCLEEKDVTLKQKKCNMLHSNKKSVANVKSITDLIPLMIKKVVEEVKKKGDKE